LLRRPDTVFAFSHVLDLFVHKFAGGSGRRFAFAQVFFGFFYNGFFRHFVSFPSQIRAI
jgi:hypothetical protein